MAGFFESQRNSHPIKIGQMINNEKVVSTYYKTTKENVFGEPYVRLSSGKEIKITHDSVKSFSEI